MLGKKSNFAVACVLASTSQAVLNSDKVSAYQRALASEKYNNEEEDMRNQSASALMPSYIPTI